MLLRYWSEFAHWSRALYISIMFGLDIRDTVLKRLEKNAKDFADLIRTYYGSTTGQNFEDIVSSLYRNLFAATDALYRGEADTAKTFSDNAYDNADQLVALIGSINRQVNQETLRNSLYSMVYMSLRGAALVFANRYDESVREYDKLVDLAAKVADEMAFLLVTQLRGAGI